MRALMAGLVMLMAAGPALAQDKAQSLADIKAELAALSAQFTGLKQELVTTGAVQSGAAGGDALQRMDAIEAQLVQLTKKTEAVEMKVNQVISQGGNRLGDLEFRVCELEEGCDPATVGQTPLAGGSAAAAPVAAAPAPAAGPDLAVGEQSDFDRAKGVLGQGDFRGAADQFATFAQSYPGSSLMQEASVLRGDALTNLGETSKAARSYLDSFSAQPTGPFAAEALMKLGRSLGTLGQVSDACVTLAEVGKRFAGSGPAAEAATAMQGLSCPAQ